MAEPRAKYEYSSVPNFGQYLSKSEPRNVVRRAATMMPSRFIDACRKTAAHIGYDAGTQLGTNKKLVRTYIAQIKRLLTLRNLVELGDDHALSEALKSDPVLCDLAFEIAVSRDVLAMGDSEVKFIASRFKAGEALMADLLVGS